MNELEQYKHNLALLKEQAARYGMDVPISLQNNIYFHERRIQELEANDPSPLSRWQIIKEFRKERPRQFDILFYFFIGGLLIIYSQYFGDKDSFIGFVLVGSKWIWDACVGIASIVIGIKMLYLLFLVIFKGEK